MPTLHNVKKEQLDQLKGFDEQELKTPYEVRRLRREGLTMVLFTSGKLLLQGKQHIIEQQLKELELLGIGTPQAQFKQVTGMIIGSDESLKGDTFGGIVVAAVQANDQQRKELLKLGVADSKTLTDEKAIVLAELIKTKVAYHIENLYPEEYNKHTKVTPLLNTLHKKAAQALGAGTHVVDKYPGCTVGDIQEEKADSKYVEVAAASIVARAAALYQLKDLSDRAGFTLPKGSTHVKEALQEIKKRELSFADFTKVHFANVQEYLND